MDNADIHNLDQCFMDLKNYAIPLLHKYFEECMKVGFTRKEALELTRDVFTRQFRKPHGHGQ